ncbi:hypothetical protein [Rubricoccus marinus]|uniref:Lipoprotein n=1 Tax=Rubricoccus marinus TaxID=716817 RepID=A0A259TYX5_9BACT|nr:hypothetical protein [Rubricoccus marinus]OZC02973.1 hypothetical protein BSZ36_08310 [Rubricoccus marinus]
MRYLLPFALLLLAACGSDPAPEAPATGDVEVTSNETATGAVPPRIGDIAGPEAAPTREAGPNEVVFVEVGQVGVVTVESAEGAYDVNLDRMDVREGIDAGAASPEAIDAWLARFAPLEGAGTYRDMTPADVQANYTAVITFVFVDDSGRTLFLQERPDGVAVVSQPDGPVWRLAPEAYADLVPLASRLRTN